MSVNSNNKAMAQESPRGSEGNGISLEELDKPENSELKTAYLEYGALVSDEYRDGAPKPSHDTDLAKMFKGIDADTVESIKARVHSHSAAYMHEHRPGTEIANGNEYGYQGEKPEIDQMPKPAQEEERNAA